MVGTPVNQVGECLSKDLKKLKALNLGKTTILPPANKGAKIEATIPWIWNEGISIIFLSFLVNFKVSQIFLALLIIFL